MPLNFLADESLNFNFVRKLRNEGFNVFSVVEENRSISDEEVLQMAENKKAILIAEDSDFGEWVFAHHKKVLGIIFLRYFSYEFEEMAETLLKIVKREGINLKGKFVVITPKKIRIRTLD